MVERFTHWLSHTDVGGGGGGAMAVGTDAAPPYLGGNGGAGAGRYRCGCK